MGQKVSPHGLRVGVIKDWDSKWYADKNKFSDYLVEDHQIREFIKKKLYSAGISKILISRSEEGKINITCSTARPGMVIGKSGAGIDELKKQLEKLTGKSVNISIEEIRRSELDAQLTAESVADALEHRVSFRRAMKQAMTRTTKAGAKGVKILCSGRLGGAEIARSEKYSEGNVPLHTLRADIDYGFAEADTTYGRIGVKVWINHGEILDKGLQSSIREEKRDRRDGRRNGRRNDRRRPGGNDRRRNGGRRDEHRAAKSVYTRKRAPKPAPAAEAPAEAPETAETNE